MGDSGNSAFTLQIGFVFLIKNAVAIKDNERASFCNYTTTLTDVRGNWKAEVVPEE